MSEQEPRDGAAERAPRERGRDATPNRGSRSSSGSAGDRKPYAERADGKKPYAKRDGDRPYAQRDGDRKPYVKRDGDKPYAKRDGERKPYVKRDGDKPYAKRDGERKPFVKREGDKPYGKRDGEKRPYAKRDGDKPYAKRDGDKPYAKRDGDRPYAKRDGERKPYAKREGDKPYGSRPTRGGADRPDRAVRDGEIRSVRPSHDDPIIPDEVTAKDLHPSARNELKTLSKENADQVARHLAMAAQLIDEDPELAHQHALSASRRAGRIAVVRETLAITAYATGDYGLALRELRTYRRISGKDDQIALLVDSERGVGRPDRALETGRAVDRASLPTSVRVELAIAMSGARLDLGEPDRALGELDIPELDPDRAFEWSPALFSARAAVLEELGRAEEADRWRSRALIAAEALDAAAGVDDLETIFVEEVEEESDGESETEASDGESETEASDGESETEASDGESETEASDEDAAHDVSPEEHEASPDERGESPDEARP
ncbi:primosomal protein [Microbacterium sp. I2]|uniref:primosomal protein n=1 Tax=Microbacterium sp. I2 TaxID=3391826 RepID=UPI003ED91220